MLCATAFASASGLSGCLLGQTFAPDDAEFRPLMPPVIVEESQPTDAGANPMSTPLPGSFVVLPPSGVVVFRVCVRSGSRDSLVARYFANRSRPCLLSRNNCGIYSNDLDLPFSDAGDCRVLQFTFDFSIPQLAGRTCFPFDLYISSRFKASFNQETLHLPEREGDVAHARWYMVRAGAIPTIDQCCASNSSEPGCMN